MRFRGENPVYKRVEYGVNSGYSATYSGVTLKTFILLVIVAGVGMYTAYNFQGTFSLPYLISGLVIAPIMAIVMVVLAHRMSNMAHIFSLSYALFEGMFLGLISLFVYEIVGFEGISYAFYGTFGSLAVMLFLYRTRIIKVSNGFVGFLLTSLVTLIVLGIVMFIFYLLGGFNSAVGWGIYVSIAIFSTIISSLFLLYDFRRIEEYVNAEVDKSHEWSLALGLVTTIVWIYVEILRLVMIFADN